GCSVRNVGFSAPPPPRLSARAEMLDHRRGKVAKQRVIAQQSQLVTRAFRRPLAAWNRHESSPVQTNLAIRTALSNTPATTGLSEARFNRRHYTPCLCICPVYQKDTLLKEAKPLNAR